MKDFRHLYYLTRIEGLGPIRIKRLLEKFGSAEKVFEIGSEDLVSTDGIDTGIAKAILNQRLDLKALEKDYVALLLKLEKLNVGVVTFQEDNYPYLLKKIYDPPLILYFKGNLLDPVIQESLKYSFSIVGTRKPTEYGKKITTQLSVELSDIGLPIVSGFARGIDTIAHRAVLEKNGSGGLTVAVLGCGVNIVYPQENEELYKKLCERGLVISEFEISAKPDAVNFPRRNRIISGLSIGVLVVESKTEGGALITARCALDQSREVFAIPGNISEKNSGGTNNLIKYGRAKLVENINDILDELQSKLKNITSKTAREKNEVSVSVDLKGNEKLIYDVIISDEESVDIDTISENTELNISDCLVTLLNMEFKGLIKQLPGKRFIRS
ncbi:MAG: DNA-processing protein DprA [Ignavibacteria bacterium]